MDDSSSLTLYSLLKSYPPNYREIVELIKPKIIAAENKSKSTGKEVHEVLMLEHKEKQYGCSIFHSPVHHYCMVYLLIPGKSYFEVFGFDEYNGAHHLYEEHFFQRYAERLQLKHKSHFEILEHYVRHNPIILYSRYITRQDKQSFFSGVVRSGAIYGTIDRIHRVVYFKTLINWHKLSPKRMMYVVRLRFALARLNSSTKHLLTPPFRTRM